MPGEPPAVPKVALKKAIGPRMLLFFIIGDILGTTIYALTGEVAGKVGGALWLPFLIAFVVAFLTAFSYLELVGKYPRAGGAPLYVHKAFGVHLLTFLIAFAVMSSGITSASSAAQAFSGDYLEAIVGENVSGWAWLVAIGFLVLLSVINFRGVSESVRMNVVLTCVEITGLLIVIVFGAYALFTGTHSPDIDPDPGRLVRFDPDTTPLLAVTSATALAFFAMVGFEDSVNMAEETKNPTRSFPRALLLGMSITATIYLLIALITSTLVPTDTLAASDGPLLLVVQAAAPWFPPFVFSLIALFAVTNTALINMMMASRLVYGMAQEHVIPSPFAVVHPARRTPWVSTVHQPARGDPGEHAGDRRSGQHDVAAAARRVHGRQHRRARAAARRGRARTLPRTDLGTDPGSGDLRVLCEPAVRSARHGVHRGGHSAGDRPPLLADQRARRTPHDIRSGQARQVTVPDTAVSAVCVRVLASHGANTRTGSADTMLGATSGYRTTRSA
ncbi:amino acid transporter [Saccharomonospora azurea SZMC 14600]|nr:amino acid transporter [Saccharomonospora azurea SZMC 14600]